MSWEDDLDTELERRQQEQRTANELKLYRRRVFAEEGRALLEQLAAEVQRGCKRMATRRPGWARVLCDPIFKNSFTVRNPSVSPSVKVRINLGSTALNISVEKQQSASDPFSATDHHRVDFSLDENDKLAFCLECSPLDIHGIASLIVRPALGLA